ncbi:hypothetical protein [Thiolapillus sp.]
MADILPFRRPRASDRHRGNTLCRHGHHKWSIDKERVFDTRQGCLVTRLRCTRCGKTKIRLL